MCLRRWPRLEPFNDTPRKRAEVCSIIRRRRLARSSGEKRERKGSPLDGLEGGREWLSRRSAMEVRMDYSRFPLLTAEDQTQLAYGDDALIVVSPGNSVTIYHPMAADHIVVTQSKENRLGQFIAAAEEAGVVLVDARKGDLDAFVDHLIDAPLPALGRFADQKIAFNAEGPGWISATAYARSFAVLGARVINADALT